MNRCAGALIRPALLALPIAAMATLPAVAQTPASTTGTATTARATSSAAGSGGAATSAAAASPGGSIVPDWVLCPPSGASGLAPFLTGTDLSCAPD